MSLSDLKYFIRLTPQLTIPVAHNASDPVHHLVSVSINDASPEILNDKKEKRSQEREGPRHIFIQYSTNTIEKNAGIDFGKKNWVFKTLYILK